MKNIVLIGLSGSGKTTIGELLSKRLGMEFYDSDIWVQEKEGRTIAEMFSESEDTFREAETRAIRELSAKEGVIIATGGGVIKRTVNIDMLHKNGIVIYIIRQPALILKSTSLKDRPLLAADENKIYALYKERKELYEKASHITITNDREIEECLEEIIRTIKAAERQGHCGSVTAAKQQR